MSLQGSGRAGAARVPIRGFAKLLNHLPAVIRSRVEQAFTEAEDLLNFHNLSTSDRQTRRALSGLLESPIIQANRSILGGSVEWERVDDRRVAMYEVQLDTSNVFPDPESYTVLEPFFSIENIDTARWVRVRPVTQDGRAGNWSNTAVINPLTTAPRAHTFIFYPEYIDEGRHKFVGLAQKSAGETVLFDSRTYAGEAKYPNAFYTILEAEFTPETTRIDGGMSAWGYISCRTKSFIPNSLIRPWDRIRFKVNGMTRMEHHAQLSADGWGYWSSTFTDSGRFGRFTDPGYVGTKETPMSFYTRGGYTFAFGPWFEPLEALPKTRGQGPREPNSISQSGSGESWGTAANSGLDNAKVLDPPDFQDADAFGIVGADIDFTTVGNYSKFLKFQDFGFDIPLDATVRGIKVWLKRAVTASERVEDTNVQLLDTSGNPKGSNKASSTFPWVATYLGYNRNVGYATFGGENDLWGTTWTPAQINDPDFGIYYRAQYISGFLNTTGWFEHAQIAVAYDEFYSDTRLKLTIDVMPLTNFYIQREIFGACFNVLEVGQKEIELDLA